MSAGRRAARHANAGVLAIHGAAATPKKPYRAAVDWLTQPLVIDNDAGRTLSHKYGGIGSSIYVIAIFSIRVECSYHGSDRDQPEIPAECPRRFWVKEN
jgi:hypothetical protein